MTARISAIAMGGLVWVAQIVAISPAAGRAETLDGRFLQGLRDRQLFALAEEYCSNRLQESRLSDAKRAELAIEHSRTLAEHAIQLPGAQRPPYWKRARAVGEVFVRDHPNSPRVLLVRLQMALSALADGELGLQEADVTGVDSFDASRDALRTSISELQQLDEAIVNQLARQNRSATAETGQLSTAALGELQNHVRFQLARAFRNQGLSYPDGSADRINALTQAGELLHPLGQLPTDNSLALVSLLDEAMCNRLLRDYPSAERTLDDMQAKSPGADVAQRARAEYIHLALDRGQIDKALAIAGRPGPGVGGPNTELDDARLQAYLAARSRSHEHNDAVQTADWEEDATRQVRYIAQMHAPYWARRAEGMIARAIRGAPETASGNALEQAAASYYRAGQFVEAVDAYDQAATQARDRNRADDAFRLGLSAATIEAEQKHAAEAATRYRELALAMPHHPKAADVHLLAIYYAGQAAQAQQPPDLAEYEKLLREHLAGWPHSSTVGQARWWLGRLEEHERAWHDAIDSFGSVPSDHAQYAAAIEAEGRCYDQWLADLRAGGKPDPAVARQAVDHFQRILTERLARGAKSSDAAGSARDAAKQDGTDTASDVQPQYPQQWDPIAAAATLARARISVHQLDDFAAAEQLLRAALRSTSDVPVEWDSAARTLLVESLAGLGELQAAQTQLHQLTAASPADILAMLEGLARLADELPPTKRNNLALLELEAVDLLDAGKSISDADQLRLQRVRAAALVDAGRGDEALPAWQALAQRIPGDGAVQEQYAKLLSDGGDEASQKAALTKWHEIRDKSRPGTPRWFRANLGLAEGELKLGRKPEARAIVKLLELSYPELGGNELRPRFQDVLAHSKP